MPSATTAMPTPLTFAPPEQEIARLARRYRQANSGAMALVNRFGTRIEEQLQSLPAPLRERVDDVTRLALERSYGVARLAGSAPGPRLGGTGQVVLASLSGAAGGFGGLPTAVAELPVTITLILRAIQSTAEEHGFDPAEEATLRETLRVFGAGGPLSADDGVNSAFLGARLTLTGPTLQRLIAGVAPRLAAAMGQKLAAQAVPVLGAVAGAGLNVAYMRYYREMAQVRFGLLGLAARHDPAEVLAAFRSAAEPARAYS